jgi:tripartite-type tricarboxylate transporter receptor subunit TctC
MLSRREMLLSSLGAAVAAPALPASAFAQDAWPKREIHSICMFPPGGGADILARFFSKKLQDAVDKTVVVENKVGSFGNIASEYVARSKPDGYTLYLAPGNLLAVAPHVYTKLGYDPINDFDHITTLFKIPFVLVVAGDSPIRSVADLVDDIRKKGDQGSFGSISTLSLVAAELFKKQFNLSAVEVKYKEPNAGIQDLLGGNLSFIYIDTASVAAHLKSGKLRALALTTKGRTDAMKDVPGSAEVGITNTDLYSWWAAHTPKGTPQPIREKLETIFNKIVLEPETKQFVANIGADPLPGNSKLARELIVNGVKDWGDYVKMAKIEPFS